MLSFAEDKLGEQIDAAWEDFNMTQKVPVLGGRTPLQAVRDPDGKEIVEALLLDWERHADDGEYQAGIRPDFNAVRRLLNLASTAS
jgi:hypothetical protein